MFSLSMACRTAMAPVPAWPVARITPLRHALPMAVRETVLCVS
jgi:hypothetical protein